MRDPSPDPLTVGCRLCERTAGFECCSTKTGRRTKTHAIRWADAKAGRDPETEPSNVIDFDAARDRVIARRNGARL